MVNFKDVKKGDYLEMAAYSIDLRKKILSAWQNKEGTQRELAKRFKVSL
jgi:transposase